MQRRNLDDDACSIGDLEESMLSRFHCFSSFQKKMEVENQATVSPPPALHRTLVVGSAALLATAALVAKATIHVATLRLWVGWKYRTCGGQHLQLFQSQSFHRPLLSPVFSSN